MDADPATRSCLKALLIVVGVFIVAQSVVVATNYKKLWPFSPVKIYTRLPSDLQVRDMNIVAVTPEAEVDAARVGSVESLLLKLLYRHLKHAESDAEAQAVFVPLLAYLRSENSDGSKIDGVRLYELEWDLAAGKVTGSKLLREYLEP